MLWQINSNQETLTLHDGEGIYWCAQSWYLVVFPVESLVQKFLFARYSLLKTYSFWQQPVTAELKL